MFGKKINCLEGEERIEMSQREVQSFLLRARLNYQNSTYSDP